MEENIVKKPKRNCSTLFKPGVSGNPKGRPLSYSGIKAQEYAEVRKLAADNYKDMFNVLLERGLQGEAWAQQLYYREFIPKRAREATVTLDTTDTTTDGQIKALSAALASFSEVGEDETKERLKLMIEIKKAEKEVAVEGGIISTREELEGKLDQLEHLIAEKQRRKESMQGLDNK